MPAHRDASHEVSHVYQYRIAGNFRGRKPSRISRIFDHQRSTINVEDKEVHADHFHHLLFGGDLLIDKPTH